MKSFVVAFVILGTFLLLAPPPVQAQQTWTSGCVGGTQSDVATLKGLECLAINILNVATSAIGLVAFGMLIYGSMMYLFSGGSPQATDGAKKAITYAIVGIVVAVSSFAILNFFAKVTQRSNLLEFSIPE